MEGEVKCSRTDKVEHFPDGRVRAERHDVIEGRLRPQYQCALDTLSSMTPRTPTAKERFRAEHQARQEEYARWNAEVDRRKAEKRAARRAQAN
jgi:hypothetical protein